MEVSIGFYHPLDQIIQLHLFKDGDTIEVFQQQSGGGGTPGSELHFS